MTGEEVTWGQRHDVPAVRGLKATTSTWIESYNAGDVEKMVALYEEDAVLMPPHASVAQGHAALSASHKLNRKWLYHRDTWNSDRPVLAPAPAKP